MPIWRIEFNDIVVRRRVFTALIGFSTHVLTSFRSYLDSHISHVMPLRAPKSAAAPFVLRHFWNMELKDRVRKIYNKHGRKSCSRYY